MELTDNIPLAAALRRLAPFNAGLGYATVGTVPQMWQYEDPGLANSERYREFAAGRHAAREALRSIGRPARALERAPDGGPLWPEGIVGAITHAGGHALALVAERLHYDGLGLDLVAPADWPEFELWPLFLSSNERLDCTPDRAAAFLAAKEAVIKLLRDSTGWTYSFADINVILTPVADGYAYVADGPVARRPPLTTNGRVLRVANHILAVCSAPRHIPATDGNSTP